MSTYKVIQDIEAEDHILGPLSLRQFIYALVAIFFFYLSFIFLTKHVPFLLVITLPPALFAGFFAFPFGRDQPTEVWALAKLRFLFKPRKRLWDQSGLKELVTITVPKKVERILTDGLNQDQVNSRLQALANTIDSRGWAVKNVNLNSYTQPGLLNPASDRLVDPSTIPQIVPNDDIKAADDILDERSNPIAQQFEQLINASSREHRQQLIDQMNGIRDQQIPAAPVATTTQSASVPPADYWFMSRPTPDQVAALPADQAMFNGSSVVQPGTAPAAVAVAQNATADEAALVEHFKQQSQSQQVSYAHLRTLQPLGQQEQQGVVPPAQTIQPNTQAHNVASPASTPQATPQVAAPETQITAVTPTRDPAILSLAHNNDLNISTLAREAYKAKNPDEPPADEVVISFH